MYVKNATKISATVRVKSSSSLYDPNSSVDVHFGARYVTLATDVKQRSFPNVNLGEKPDPEKLKAIVTGVDVNNDLRTDEVQIKNIQETNGTVTAVLTVIEGSKIYLVTDTLKLYFSSNNRKLLSEVLTNQELGDILNKEPETIINKIGELNPEVYVNEIEFVADSITSEQALIKVRTDSVNYIINSESVTVNYRVFNPNIGTIKSVVEQPDENFDGEVLSLVQLDTGIILAGTYRESIYQLNPDGTIKAKIDNNHYLKSLVQLKDGTILAAGNKRDIYYLNNQ
ncbi:hypothetical protein [Spiroplasma chrysopicola]|uniref:Uncharacterized protein n=1 Tax=Spiroplasma chrysopicola DF-1 TaxID=1276227 RepID=R4U3E3_9MOLU|nr:hypothetical protein [Spiroplasma chrysopicola]AGM25018.1 hypothetical protein SCHRY_v1c04370 [Spiroplasma chrysopicola DF-1]